MVNTVSDFRVCYSLFFVLKYDIKTKLVDYKCFPDFDNYVRPSQVASYNYYAFVYFFEQLWILALVNVKTTTITMLNVIKGQENTHTEIIKSIVKDQTGITVKFSVVYLENFQFLQKENPIISGCISYFVILNL